MIRMAKKDNSPSGPKSPKVPGSGGKLLFDNLDDEIDLEDDDEDDEQHKAPLIKGSIKSNLKNNGSRMLKKKSVKFDNSIDSIEEDGEESMILNTTGNGANKKSKNSLNSPPPITIGKIKIFKPSSRRRWLRIRRFLKHCFGLVFCIGFLTLLLLNLKSLPEFIRATFGIQPYHTIVGNKDKSLRCDQVVSTPVWRQNFPMLTIESALRMVAVNNDSVLDVIIPFGTGIDAAYYDDTLCQIYFNQTREKSKVGCGGGVMALDGTNGEPIWARYTPHEMFASNCNADLNGDATKDCIVGGRMASLYAFDGRTGRILWSITANYGEPISETSNFYTPLLIPKDVDNDNVPEIIVMHGGDPLRKPQQRIRNVARLMVISGKTGRILRWNYVPNNAESYYSPQMLVHPDGTQLILYGTGGETHPGSLYVVGLEALLNGQLEHGSRAIYEDCCKGIIAPPVLMDINGDEILDIILASFNSTVYAFDGLTFQVIWKRSFPGSETYSTPSAGYFNDDDVPDFGIIYQFGPGFPIYYYSEFQILDGKNGQPLLKSPIRMSIGTQSSPLTVSTMVRNDIFLFWYSSCYNGTGLNSTDEIKNNARPYEIRPDATVHESSRADFCRLRYGQQIKQFTKFLAITPPDTLATVYDSRTDEPLVEPLNFTEISLQWYQQNLAVANTATSGAGDENGVWGAAADPIGGVYVPTGQDDSLVNPNDAFRKYKRKWPPSVENDDRLARILFPQNINQRWRRHVGLHNGDAIQRVISTGTLAPSLKVIDKDDDAIVDGSIDVLFATYSFPPSSNVRLQSEAMKRCRMEYLSPEKEAELRMLNENSPFKQMNYDHDAYEAAINEICAKKIGDPSTSSATNPSAVPSSSMLDAIKANDWIREMGSMTVHRVNLKCFDRTKKRQIQVKEYKYQRWPSYLGIRADSVANVLDE